jgi:glycosyltransferase involved in cell wall biosynthesis
LAGLGDFSEVVVVDSQSTDRTRQIASDLGARVETFDWNRRYPKKKQWQLDNVQTRNEWVLFMDADETPSTALVEELRALFADGSVEADAFDIDLDYVFAGRLLRHGHRVTKRCLMRRHAAQFPEVDDLDIPGMGELEGHYQPTVRGRTAHLTGRILHNDLDPVSSWFARHNRYSDWEAHLRTREGARKNVRSARTLKGRVFDAVPFKPLFFFLYAYVFRAGFLDGRPGFDYAFALSTYYWQIELKVRELHSQDRKI